MITTKKFTTLDESFLSEWLELWKNSSEKNFVNSPAWIAAIKEAFGFTENVFIGVYKNSELVGAAGFVKEKRFGLSCYTVPPGDFVSGVPLLLDSSDFAVVRAFVREFVQLGTVFFDNVPESFVSVLQKETTKILAVPFSINLFLRFEADEKGKVIITKRKRLLRESKPIEDKIRFESFEGNNEELLQIAFDIDRKSTKHSKGYDAFADKTIQKFYRSLASYFGSYLRLNFLYIDSVPVVYEMGFLIGDTYYGSQIAFDEKYREFSPGKAFEVKLIEWLFANEVKKIDYGSGDNFIKRTLCTEHNQLYKVVVSANIFVRLYIGLLYFSKDRVFTFLTNNPRLYSLYRSIRKSIGL